MTNGAKIIQKMNELIIDMGNEFTTERWLQLVPDEATEEDFEFIIEDDELCEEVTFFFFNNWR